MPRITNNNGTKNTKNVPSKKNNKISKKNTEIDNINTEDNENKVFCLHCGTKNQSIFYKSYDVFNKTSLIPYCRNCIKNVLYPYYLKKCNNQENIALHHLLRSLNVCYIHDIYITSVEQLKNPNATINNIDGKDNSLIVSAYFKNFNSLHNQNNYGDSYLDSDGLNKIQGLQSFDDIIKIKYNKDIKNNQSGDYEIIEYDIDYLIQKFGNFPPEDLAFLEEQYLQWKDKLGKFIYEKSTEMNVIMICHEYLKIRKKNELGEKTKDEIDTIQKIMAVSGLIEKQSQNDKRCESIGMEIAEIEKSRPIKPVRTELDDVDGYRKQIECFTGAMCRALGKENQFTKTFDEVMGKYKLDIFSNDGELNV